jgi:Uri superfamily endonuclease
LTPIILLRPLLLSQPRNFKTVKGSYILLVQLPEKQTITVGSLKDIHFPSGYYAYVGSAMGGIKSRLSHHCKQSKRPHWHIDYLLQKAFINGVILCETRDRVECAIAQALSHQFDSIPRFGCSDCRCQSHLFFATKEMKSEVIAILNRLGMQPRLMQDLN